MSMSYTILDGRDKDDLNANIQNAKSELTEDIQAASSALHASINSTKTELQGNIDTLEAKHDSDKSNLQSQIDDKATKAELEAHNVSSTAHNDIREIIENLDTGKIDDTMEVTDGMAVCEEHLGSAPLVGTKVYGETRQNLWVNVTNSLSGITATANANGSVTLSGTYQSGAQINLHAPFMYTIKPNTTYAMYVDKVPVGFIIGISRYGVNDDFIATTWRIPNGTTSVVFTTGDDFAYSDCVFYSFSSNFTGGTYRVMLREATQEEIEQNQVLDTTWYPPGLNSIDSLKLITASKNILTNTLEDTTYNTMSVKINDDGSITLDGKNKTSVTALNFDFSSAIPPVGTVVSQFKESYSGAIVNYGFYTSDGSYHDVLSNTTGNNYTITEDDVSMRCYVRVTGSAEFDNVTIRPCLTIGETCEDFYPMDKSEVSIDLNDNALRSLPDGTRDELSVDAEGNCTLVKRAEEVAIPSGKMLDNPLIEDVFYRFDLFIASEPQSGGYENSYSDKASVDGSRPNAAISVLHSTNANKVSFFCPISKFNDAESAKAAVESLFPLKLIYRIAPQTISLGKISLPKMPFQTSFVWFDSSITVNDFDIRYWLPSGELVANLYDRDSYTLLDMYPVDSVYLTMASSNPSALFGGQWEEVSDVVNSESGVYAWRRIE